MLYFLVYFFSGLILSILALFTIGIFFLSYKWKVDSDLLFLAVCKLIYKGLLFIFLEI